MQVSPVHVSYRGPVESQTQQSVVQNVLSTGLSMLVPTSPKPSCQLHDKPPKSCKLELVGANVACSIHFFTTVLSTGLLGSKCLTALLWSNISCKTHNFLIFNRFKRSKVYAIISLLIGLYDSLVINMLNKRLDVYITK